MINETDTIKLNRTAFDTLIKENGEFMEKASDYERCIRTTLATLIVANVQNKINDTIWVDKFTTLFDYLSLFLFKSDDEFKNFEKEILSEHDLLK